MKIRQTFVFAVSGILLLSVGACSKQDQPAKSGEQTVSFASYLGRWDLTLKGPDREYPSWLELVQENGQLKASFVGRWGNARPLPKADLKDGQLTFVSPKDEEALTRDMVFEGKLVAGALEGTVNGTKDETWTWRGERAPDLKSAGEPKWGEPVQLFDGKSLAGWSTKPSGGTGTTVWTVKEGKLVSPGGGQELVNNSTFKDFKLHVEFNCGPDANSGIYLRGRYEVQIETESQAEPPSHHMGGIYGFLAPNPEQPRKPGVWQTYDITLVGRTVTVVQNGQTIIDHQEIPGITGGALDSHEGDPGPLYLQGSEKGHVQFRKIVLTPAAE